MSDTPNTQTKFKLIPDDAIERKDQDRFRHGVFVSWLLSALESAEKPINIGLFGKWGTGKTGILQLFKDRVKSEYDEKYQYCYIDCWKISPDHIRQQLLLEINKLLRVFSDDYIINRLYRTTETRDSISKTQKLTESIKELKKTSIIFPIVATIIIMGGLTLNQFFPDENILYMMVLFLVPIVTHLVVKSSQNNKTQHIKQIPPLNSHVDFKKLFEDIVSKKSDKNNKKLIIALDNLDRCDGDVALEILSLVKSFMEEPRVFFIIPCDVKAIIEHLQTKDNFVKKDTARDYLRKFFQVSVIIPPITPSSMMDYVEELTQQYNIPVTDEAKYVISVSFMSNPRHIKQFLNHYIANYHLALEIENASESLRKGTITGETGFLMKILVLYDKFSDFYDELAADENLLVYVEKYFSNREISDYEMKKIESIIKQSELKEFLKQTRRIRVGDIRPFIRLAQEPHEKSPMYATILNNTQTGNHEELVEIVKSNPDKLDELLETIKKIIDEDFRKGRYESGANGLDVVLHIYKIISRPHKNELAAFFGVHASTKEVLDKIDIYDEETVFRAIQEMGNKVNQNTILEKYCELALGSNSPDGTMHFLTVSSHLFSDATTESFRKAMAKYYDSQEWAAAALINQSFKEHMIKLLDNKIIKSILSKITNDASDANRRRITTYLKIKQVSDYISRNDFIQKLYRIIPEPTPTQIDDNLDFVLQILEKLDYDDVDESGFDILYTALINIESKLSDENQKIIILRPILKHFHKLSDDIITVFINKKLQKYIKWSDAVLTELLTSMDLSEKKLLDREEIFNIIFGVVHNSGRRILFEYLIKNATGDQREKIINLIISHIQSPNETIRHQTCAAISNTYENLEEIDQLVPSIIDSSRHTEYPDRVTILTLLDKVFVKCSLNMQNTIVLEFINLMKDINNRNIGRDCLNAVWSKLNDLQKSDTWDQLMKLLDEADIDSAPGPFFELVIDEKKVIQDNYHHISKFLISQAEQKINKETYLKYLSKLGNLVQFDDETIRKINELQEE